MTNIQPGEYRILRVDGTIEHHFERPTLSQLRKLIQCDTFDTVLLDKNAEQVMIVDDTGMIDGKPINPRATDLYHQKVTTPHCIHGDVALVHDQDFA